VATAETRPDQSPCVDRDVVTGMFARYQIDDAMFQAARKYQRLSEQAGWASAVSGHCGTGRLRKHAGLCRGDRQGLAARHELQHVEAQIYRKLGEDVSRCCGMSWDAGSRSRTPRKNAVKAIRSR
jgi:hypothetical protein